MARNRASSVKAYWRQVHAVQAMTGTSSAQARRAVTLLRAERGYRTAAETKRHPVIVNRASKATESKRRGRRDRGVVEPPPEPPVKPTYRDLSDWISTFDEWEGDYDYYEIETNADY